VSRTVFYKSLARFCFILVAAISLSGVDVSPDNRKIEPFLLATDQPAVVAAQRKMMEAAGPPDLPVPVFIHMKSDDPELPARLGNLGGSGRPVHSRLYTGRIPRDAARYISNWPQVAYIESAKRAKPLLDLSRPAVSADNVQAGTGLPAPFNLGITGTGMYVAAVDTGLSGNHLDFHTAGQGSPSRVVHTYASPNLASLGLSPDPLVDEDGHGTHVMGIAAGNGFSSAGKYTGMAPDAGILIGKTSFFTTDIITAAQNLISFAEANSRPIPLNLSLGLMLGPHDGSSGFESGINSLAAGPAGSRRLIAAAAGNESGKNEHFQTSIDSFGTASIPLSLKGRPPPGVPEYVDIWAEGEDQFKVTATMGSDVVTVPSGSSGSSPGGRISVSNRFGGPHPINGTTYIFVTFIPLAGGGPATIRLDRTRNGKTGKVDAYIDDRYGTFDVATDSGTITEPANGSAVVSVGSYNTKTSGGSSAAQNLSSFSSLGPTRDGRLKPDVTAPGFIIYSAKSLDRTWPPSELVPGDNNYVIMAGTSMATPHITGIAALAWQSNSSLTGAQMRERIKRTASAPTDGSAAPNTTWGYGKVNALAAVRNSVASITAPATAVPGSQVSLTSENSSGAFGNPLTPYAWSLTVKPAGSGASLSTPFSASSGFTPDVPGDYTVTLTVSQATPAGTPAGSATATVHVNNIPSVASVTGPASSDNLAPVSFKGTGSDPDGQALAFHWVLVSRPAGSSSTLSTADVDNVTLAPDVAGTYEAGLRVDDGLDNSTLAVHTFTAAGVPAPSSGSGGGGCSVANRNDASIPSESESTVLSLLLPAGLLAARRRIIRTKLRASRIPPRGRPAGP